jgi:hypothetical protein
MPADRLHEHFFPLLLPYPQPAGLICPNGTADATGAIARRRRATQQVGTKGLTCASLGERHAAFPQ